MTCYHVTTSRGHVYGVAATSKLDALVLTAARLVADGSDDSPARAVQVGTWSAEYGTVLAYR